MTNFRLWLAATDIDGSHAWLEPAAINVGDGGFYLFIFIKSSLSL